MHIKIQVWSLKKYSAETITNALKRVQFPNYDIFSNVNLVDSDLWILINFYVVFYCIVREYLCLEWKCFIILYCRYSYWNITSSAHMLF